jgi:uncharacterized repeat protein (TIGR01451 family)
MTSIAGQVAHDAMAVYVEDRWSRIWRLTIIALGMLILCSCRGPSDPRAGLAANQRGGYPALPPEAYSGAPAAQIVPVSQPGMELGVPVPYTPQGPWQPPGTSGPWPEDEYVFDGGNAGPPIRVDKQRNVRGLEMEDTVAHFDTADGRTLVEPSNRVSLYCPRFSAVRQVVNVEIDQQRNRVAGVYAPTKAVAPRTSDQIGVNTQKLQPVGQFNTHPAELLRTRQFGGAVSVKLGPRLFDNSFKPYENVALVRQGTFIESEGAFLAKGIQAAVAWNHKQAPQIYLDRKMANAEVGSTKSQETYTIGAPPNNPRLRLVKVASTPFAEPGDEVSFTIRFDNVGNQPINHVAILDSLSTRLEYIADSAQCSVAAQFSTQPNEGDSVVLRCELNDPLRPGKGGVLRFRCRVR